MAFYSIGEVAERCGINPVTLRAWQRRYGLLKPQRSEGGHRQFDDEDIRRIEEIKRWMESGVPVGKVKTLLEQKKVAVHDGWTQYQEELMAVLRHASPEKLRTKIATLGQLHSVDNLIDNIISPARQRLSLEQNTARAICSLLDGVLMEFAILSLHGAHKRGGDAALLMNWGNNDRMSLWLEAWRLCANGQHVDVLAEPLDSPRPELFPGQPLLVWTGKALTQRQQEQLDNWREQGYTVTFHTS